MKTKFTIKSIYRMLLAMCVAFSTSLITGCEEEESILSDIVAPGMAVGDAVSITNPGFENSKTGWSDASDLAISTSDTNSGSRAAKVTSSSQKFEQTVSVSANTNYTLSAYVLDKGTVGATVGGTTYDDGGDYDDFTKVSVSFNSGSNSSVTIFGAYNGGEGRFDDFELIEGSGNPGNPDNLASGGTASQSSNYSSSAGLAGNAIDGDTNGNWNAGSVTHTQTGAGEWWKVDLGSTEPIGEIVLYNRTNCCMFRLNNVTVSVENTSGSVLWSQNVSTSSVGSFMVDAEGTSGRVIRVTQNSNYPLSLAEVEVFEGESVSACSFGSNAVPSGNLAYGRSTSQSSTYTGTGGESCKAVDGNTSGNWNNQSVTHTQSGGEPWWEVYLASNTSVGEIKIFNRTNCCSNRLENFTVSVLNSSGNTQWSQTVSSLSSSSITLDADGATGTTVRIDLDNDGEPLSLAEVQVFEHSGGPSNGTVEDILGTTWKLTVPYDASGNDSGNVSDPDDRNNNAKDYFDLIDAANDYPSNFYVSGDEVVFMAHCGGATTTSSIYPRSELRQLDNNGDDEYFDLDDYQYLDVTVRVLEVPVERPEVNMVQIHGPSDEPLRVEYNAGSQGLHLSINDDDDGWEDVIGYSLQDRLRVQVTVDNGKLWLVLTNLETGEVYDDIQGQNLTDNTGYFKVGCYLQSSITYCEEKNKPSSECTDDNRNAQGAVAVSDLTLVSTW